MASRAKPYVYRCTHKTSGKFYIGYRKANWLPASSDFGIYYFSSCPEVSNNFQDFVFEILGEFIHPNAAFEIEQKLIYESRNNNLLINQNWKKSKLDLRGRDIKSLKNCIPKDNIANGTTILVKKKRKKRKLQIPTEKERLGISNTQYLEKLNERRKKRELKKL
jgi:hypothetical protein